MYILDKGRATRALEREGIIPIKIQYLLNNYPPLDDKLGVVVEQWLSDQSFPTFEVEGILLSDVMKIRHSHFLTAVRDMNKLLDPTLSSEKHEQWHRILTTPVYFE